MFIGSFTQPVCFLWRKCYQFKKRGFALLWVSFRCCFSISFGCANDQKGKGARSCCLPFQPVPVCLGPVSRAPILLEVFAAWQCSLGAIMTPFGPVSDFVGMQGFCFTFCGAPAYYLMLYLQFYSWRIWMYSQTQVIQSVHVLTANGPGLIMCRKWQYSSTWLTPFSLWEKITWVRIKLLKSAWTKMHREIWGGGEEEYKGNYISWKSVVLHVLSMKRCYDPDQQLHMFKRSWSQNVCIEGSVWNFPLSYWLEHDQKLPAGTEKHSFQSKAIYV